ncbi:MAG: sigma-70 family RNA polymerase sigma factor [Myxococcota bacterium]
MREPMTDPTPGQEERENRWRLWMVAAQAGDRAAYESLLRDLLPVVRRIVARRIEAPSEREDVVQNVLLAVHRARHTYRPEQPLLPWLRAIARNASIDSLRRRGRQVARFESVEAIDELGDGAPERVETESRPESLSPRLRGALEALPVAQREAVALIHLEGLSVAEAASRVGVTPGALKVRAHRGYRALRGLLTRQER